MSKRNLLLLSNSTLHGSGYLEWAAEGIKDFFSSLTVKKILFVPYAAHDVDSYTESVRKKFMSWGFEVNGVHREVDQVAAVKCASAIFIGGGNTFLLLKNLHEKGLVEPIYKQVMEHGIPYMGSSAGTNVATLTICTTNDMPIVYPPSFNALSLVPFNINPHYVDADPASRHMGETREERICEFHGIEGAPCVLGLREGSFLHVRGDTMILKGLFSARLFRAKQQPEEFPIGSDLSFLLK